MFEPVRLRWIEPASDSSTCEYQLGTLAEIGFAKKINRISDSKNRSAINPEH
jgi:hypothetical protein